MRSVESTGKTVEEAIALALDELDLSIADVLIDVLDHGKQGIFGIGNKPVRVKVTELEPEEAILPKEMQAPPKPPIPPKKEIREPRPPREEQKRPQALRAEAVAPPSEASVAASKDFLGELFGHMGVKAEITAFAEEENVAVAIEGDDVAVLIGHRGETLDALQYLTTLIVNKETDERVRVRVDAAGYRARRQESLERLAHRSADRAKKTGRRVPLEPMNPYERRILHTALQEVLGITTYSEGEEPNRRVIVAPASQGVNR